MLLKNTTIYCKNHIMFEKNGNIYYESINNENKINIFNKQLMDIYLEKFDENIGILTYNDIIAISVLENHDSVIRNLPNKLKSLTVMSTMASSLLLSVDNRRHIKSIIIDKSNITTFPDISECVQLTTCKINHSAIVRFDIHYDLPKSLVELNLNNNLINNNDNYFAYNKLDNLPTCKKINLSNNHLTYDYFPEKLRTKCNLIRQNTYVHTRIINENVQILNIRNIIADNIIANNIKDDHLFSSQNVHLSSINTSVLNSVKNMQKMVQEQFITILSLEDCQKCENYKYVSLNASNLIKTNCETSTINGLTKLSYKKTFCLIWSILQYNPKLIINVNDVMNNMSDIIEEGNTLCFTGQYNRLINSVVGVIPGVQVGFSKGEELQLEFGKIIRKLNSNSKYTFEYAYCDAKEILNTIDDKQLRQVWLDAIMELQPDPITFEYRKQAYYKTWDDDVLDIREKTHIGYYVIEQKRILFLSELC